MFPLGSGNPGTHRERKLERTAGRSTGTTCPADQSQTGNRSRTGEIQTGTRSREEEKKE